MGKYTKKNWIGSRSAYGLAHSNAVRWHLKGERVEKQIAATIQVQRNQHKQFRCIHRHMQKAHAFQRAHAKLATAIAKKTHLPTEWEKNEAHACANIGQSVDEQRINATHDNRKPTTEPDSIHVLSKLLAETTSHTMILLAFAIQNILDTIIASRRVIIKTIRFAFATIHSCHYECRRIFVACVGNNCLINTAQISPMTTPTNFGKRKERVNLWVYSPFLGSDRMTFTAAENRSSMRFCSLLPFIFTVSIILVLFLSVLSILSSMGFIIINWVFFVYLLFTVCAYSLPWTSVLYSGYGTAFILLAGWNDPISAYWSAGHTHRRTHTRIRKTKKSEQRWLKECPAWAYSRGVNGWAIPHSGWLLSCDIECTLSLFPMRLHLTLGRPK